MEFRYRLGATEQTVRLVPQGDGMLIAHVGERAYRVRLQSARPGQLHFTVDDQQYEAFTAGRTQGNPALSRRYVAVVGSQTPGAARAARHYELIVVTSDEAQRAPRRHAQTELPRRTASAHTGSHTGAHTGGSHSRARGNLEAQMPGQVIQVMVHEGDEVSAGQPLLVLEAMKMVTRVVTPVAGRVARVLVQEGDTVERGQRLVDVEPAL